ncbi:hypothetical protein [Actinopolymorpha alba]|uniref:hypothetical protein n=1 Tax=Actinopolymorpha alba TaxID=533267 RepID=UPI00036F33CA|nr:hypothetical protein [Actinopolymorpha alba]
MVEQDAARARTVLGEAARAGGRTTAAGRWWSGYMVLMGLLAFGLIVAVEAFFPSFAARLAATVAWAMAIGLLGTWARSHEVQPRGGFRRLLIAMAAWFGAYLVVIGPVVRWQAGTSLGWWSAAGGVMALPFLVGAWREGRRT